MRARGRLSPGTGAGEAAPFPATPPGRLVRVARFLAAVAALCALASFPGSSLFALRDVTVEGNTVVPAAEILDRAGVHPGENAFRIDAPAIRRRVLRDPRIAEVAVVMQFPRTLRLVVRERVPVAALLLDSGFVLLGADGVAIGRAAEPGPAVPLQVDGLDLPWVASGAAVPSPAVRLGALIASSLPPDLRPEVGRIRVDEAGEVVLELRDGVAVRVGSGRGLQERLALVPQVLAALRARGMQVDYVDLRIPGSVIVKPVAGSSSSAGAPDAVPAAAPSSPGRKENAPSRGISPAIQRPSIP
jgi:cell division protein FtsQ